MPSPPEQIEIVGKDDVRYVAWRDRSILYQMALDRGRLRDPIAADYMEVLRDFEYWTLRLLAQSCGVVPEQVLLSPSTGSSRWGPYKCEEIDFVLYTDGDPALLGEVKISISPRRALTAGNGQIHRRLTKARRRWPHLRGAVICYFLDWLRPPLPEPPELLTESDLESRLDSPSTNDPEPQWFLVAGESLLQRLQVSSLLPAGFRERLDSTHQAFRNPSATLKSNAGGPTSGLLSLENMFPD